MQEYKRETFHLTYTSHRKQHWRAGVRLPIKTTIGSGGGNVQSDKSEAKCKVSPETAATITGTSESGPPCTWEPTAVQSTEACKQCTSHRTCNQVGWHGGERRSYYSP